MNIQLHYKTDKEFEAHNNSNNVLSIDMLPEEDKRAFSPTELLLSSITACAAVDIVSMIKKKRKIFIDLKAETSGDRKKEHPRGFTHINIKFIITSPNITEKELDKIIDLAVNKYCSVADSLNNNIQLTHRFQIKRA